MYRNLILFCYYCCSTTKAQSASNFVVEEAYDCESLPNQTIKLSIVPKTFEPGRQVIDITLLTPIPLGNDLRLGESAEMEFVTLNKKSHWQRMFSIEDDLCRTVQLYVGELMYRLETAWGILRGSCPIPKGNYHAVNYTFDFAQMKLQAFPFGKLRMIVKILEKRSRTLLHCSVYIISNMP